MGHFEYTIGLWPGGHEARLFFQSGHERSQWGGCLKGEDCYAVSDFPLIWTCVVRLTLRVNNRFDSFDLLDRSNDFDSSGSHLRFEVWHSSGDLGQDCLLGSSLERELLFDARVERHVDKANSVSALGPFETEIELSKDCQQ